MKVVDLHDREVDKRKKSLLEVIDAFRSRIEKGEVEEFVLAAITDQGEVEISACVKDTLGAVGLFEIGKTTLMTQEFL